ncbi:MAG: DUF1343 domain-containing protein [Candidatus Chlorobium antarcticum]|jgi:uncharacterized protein YbbC (DUF1343 family)|nr:DUF1343 domain-containing protein [Candidatus Chlorobium antarcticum]
MTVTGLDVLLSDPSKCHGRRIGLMVNQSSLTASLKYSWKAFAKKGVKIERIFSPEHGIFATEQDQIAVATEPTAGIETLSLYGDSEASLVPNRALLEGLDLIIFDMQDIGSRYYTYVNTLALTMEAVSSMDIEIMVLDRPNPLGGELVEGPMLDPLFRSFVGIFPVPVRHGLTAGELATLYMEHAKLDLKLTVIKMERWRRQMLYPETGLAWIPPSPNMPTVETAAIYPGMCLFEGLNVSEGRGSTTPFQLSGAPFIDPMKLADRCRSFGLKGVFFRPTWFRPTFHKFAGEVAGAIWLQVTDHQQFRPFATGVAMTAAIHELYGRELQFLHEVYEFNSALPAFDLLAGSDRVRTAILEKLAVQDILASWHTEESEFRRFKKTFHLY